ncbi:MAG: hypothetical protein HPY83_01270 [Anaerolineae bacterium]|nr:hypothetical protein [Anaerolineae bacterium]
MKAMAVTVRLMSLLLVAVVSSSCAAVGSGALRSESRSVPVAGVTSASVELAMGAGELEVTGGAAELVEANFTYNVARWTPEVDVRQARGRTSVEIEQGGGRLTLPALGNSYNRWEIRLNPDVPLDLKVRLGAGTTTLQLGGLALEHVDVTMGAGEAVLDLTGPWEEDVQVEVTGGVGQLRVELPAEVGVRAQVTGGLGSIRVEGLRAQGGAYVNQAYGVSDVTLELNVRGGVGEVVLVAGESQERA